MPYEFHSDPKRYFDMQFLNARDHVIPFIEETFPVKPGMKVMEVGCGEAGVLKAFWDRGCICTGIELGANRVALGKSFMPEEVASGRMDLRVQNFFDVDFQVFKGQFDLILLKDVIEHLPDQQKVIAHLSDFLAPGGQIFFGFPPWNMPFGGHQQMCKSRFLSRLPWFHILPRGLYRQILVWGGEDETTLKEYLEIWDFGISTYRFESIIRALGMRVTGRKLWFINPIYAYKFGIKERALTRILRGIPFLRDFFTTTAFYLTGK